MRAYNVAATAVTLGVSQKWLDNVLSHHRVPGVLNEKQGIQRQVTPKGLLMLEVALMLQRSLKIPISRAVEVAGELISARGREVALESGVILRVDVDSISHRLQTRLEHALEITPIPRRGRPGYK